MKEKIILAAIGATIWIVGYCVGFHNGTKGLRGLTGKLKKSGAALGEAIKANEPPKL